ncbi:MAG: mechanosensitive ion channel [Vallitaleaceae bacterium]|nr:mechanosensitive ion channel [Vallitaleaceae bacterium]
MEDLVTTLLEALKLKFIEIVTSYGLKIIFALILFLVGFKLIKGIVKITEVAFRKSKLDLSLAKFLISLIRMFLKVALAMVIVSQLIDITPIVAIGAAASIGVGMAMQGSLANLTGGILILLLRPFSIGDYINEKAFGNEGTVEDIQVFYTTLLTKDNKTVIIPNGQLANNSVINFSREKFRRVDLVFQIENEDDPRRVQQLLIEVAKAHEKVIQDKEMVANMETHSDKGTFYNLWVWCESSNYIKVKYDLIEGIHYKLEEAGISIPRAYIK